jgi:hypothetical protein
MAGKGSGSGPAVAAGVTKTAPCRNRLDIAEGAALLSPDPRA